MSQTRLSAPAAGKSTRITPNRMDATPANAIQISPRIAERSRIASTISIAPVTMDHAAITITSAVVTTSGGSRMANTPAAIPITPSRISSHQLRS
jgi:hypothetical protein